MKALLVFPDHPDTFWSFRSALRIVSKRTPEPPLGLLTVAAMLSTDWEKRLVDMQVTALRDADLEWADLVFISATSIQRESAHEVIKRCRKIGVRTVAGGPLFTSMPEDFADVDYLVLNEAEVTLPPFLRDLERGCAREIYASNTLPARGASAAMSTTVPAT